ncbi:hypothetical protein [Allochromatium vinosum]|uniref:hypothetical protein n=1 Tax=Allochromatium vinosum TaxID=1049 RepID=UPI001903BF49|nr:hypothetical protein [Allochromatium vinosum]
MSDKRSMDAIGSIFKHMDLMNRRDAFAQHVDDIPSSLTVSGIPVPKILKEHDEYAALYETAAAIALEYRKERVKSEMNPTPVGELKKPGPRPRHCPKTLGICYSRVLGDRKQSETNIDVLTDRVLNAYLEEVKATAPHSHYREWVRAWLKAYFSGDT